MHLLRYALVGGLLHMACRAMPTSSPEPEDWDLLSAIAAWSAAKRGRLGQKRKSGKTEAAE